MAKVKFTDDQQRVIDAPIGNLLVSAAAGSGKTAVLVERIIKEITDCKHPIDVDKILIVTFTRNAASSMKERLYKKLEERCASEPDNKRLLQQMSKLSYSDITTIDSFCLKVVRNYFFALDIDPDFRIIDDNEGDILLMQVIDDVLLKEYESGNQAFLSFVNAYGDAHGDKAIVELIANLINISSSHPWQKDFIKGLRDCYTIDTEEKFYESDLAKGIKRYADNIISDCIHMNEKIIKLAETDRDIADVCMSALEADAEKLNSLLSLGSYGELYDFFNTGFKWKIVGRRKKTICYDEEKYEHIIGLRDAMKKRVKALQELFFSIPVSQILDDNAGLLGTTDVIIDLTLKVLDEFNRRKKEKKSFGFSDIAHMALQILVSKDEAGNEIPTDYAIELSNNYEEIMIDEYQDSNMIQETILSAISRERNGHPNMFMVGDVKQSIYKFRMAKPELFMKKQQTYSKSCDIDNASDGKNHVIDLKMNFRSARPVIECVNNIFKGLMIKEVCGMDYDEAAALYQGTPYDEYDNNSNGAAELNLVSIADEGKNDKEQLMAVAIADKIKNMMSGDDKIYVKDGDNYRELIFSDIVILTRSRKGLAETLAVSLPDAGIPACVNTASGYFDTPEISVIMNYLSILDNPYNDIALVSVLHSYICGLTAEELALIRIYEKTLSESKKKMYFYDVLMSYIGSENADAEIVGKTTEFLTVYESIKAIKDYYSLYDLVLEIYERTGFYSYAYALPAGKQRRANLDMLLEKIKDFEDTDMGRIEAFIGYVKNLKKIDKEVGEANIGEGFDAVRIMTIHASKGLEYPVVILADMDKQFNAMDEKNAFVIHPELGLGTKLVNEKTKACHKSIQKSYISRYMHRENIAEEIRILYVALTRAKQKLVMFAGIKDFDKTYEKWMSQADISGEKLSYSYINDAKTYIAMVAPIFIYYDREYSKLPPEERDLHQRINIIDTDSIIASLGENMLDDNGAGILTDLEHKQDTCIERYQINESVKIKGSVDEKAAKNRELDLSLVEKYKQKIREYFNYSYPYKRDNVPVKYSVSELKHQAMEENEITFDAGGLVSFNTETDTDTLANHNPAEKTRMHQVEVEHEAAAIKHNRVEKVNLGALRGTLTHLFMEHAIKSDAKTYDELVSFANGKIAEGLFPSDIMKYVSIKRIEHFLATDLAKDMRAAGAEGKLYLEQPFEYGMPAKEIKQKEFETDELILIQGVIDAFFIKNGEITIVDYKTDRLPAVGGEEELIKRYKVQMDLYAAAVSSISKISVKNKILYSFSLEKEVKLE